jgi:CHAT domain-containing protein/Flp pilus assembly protein TadD
VKAEGPAAGLRLKSFLQHLLATPARAAAAAALALTCCLLLAWWGYARLGANSDIDRGLAALQSAYPNKRPVEARISGFRYIPWYVTRDGAPSETDKPSHDRAERLLLDAAQEHPGPAADHALGKLYLAGHDYDQAIALFEKAAAADEQNARLHNDLGVALLEKGRSTPPGDVAGKDIEALARSVEQFNRALELDGSLSEARFNLALAYQYMMLPRQAEEIWKEYLKRDPSSHWADEARHNLKLLEDAKGSAYLVEDRAVQSLLDARNSGDEDAVWKVVSQSYTSAGNTVTNRLVDSLLGVDTAEASVEPGAALPLLSYLAGLESTRAGDRYTSDVVRQYERTPPGLRPQLVEARRRMRAGYDLFTQLKFADAIKEYEAAKQGYGRARNAAGLLFAEYRLAHCYVFLPDLTKAALGFARLRKTADARGYRWLSARCLYGLAHVGAINSEYSKAIDYSSGALAAFERADDVDGMMRSFTQLADLNQAVNRVGRSLGYLRRELALARERPTQPKERWGLLTNMAFTLSSMRLNTAALYYHREALDLAQEMREPLRISRSYSYVGLACAAMKMYAEAVANATRASEAGAAMAEGTGGLEIMANASQQLGDIFRQSGECGKAVEAYDRSINLYGRLKFDYYSYAAHKGKLLCLLSEAGGPAADDELRTVLALFERYRPKITAESQRLSFFGKEQGVYDLAVRYEHASAGDSVRAFEYSEESRARALLDATRGGAEVLKKAYGPDVNLPTAANPMTLAQVQSSMPEGAQIIQYAVLEDRLLIWLVTKSDFRSEEVSVGAEALTEKVRSYLASVSRPPTGEGDGGQPRLAQELYKILIAPVEQRLDRTKYLCVVPDKVLHYLPFAALVAPETGRYLMEDYDNGVAPSSTIFVGMSASPRAKDVAPDERLLSVGDPAFSRGAFPSLPDLPAAAREASAVSAYYKSRRILRRGEATEALVKTELTKADVAHLAMHYVTDESSEMLSGFPLAMGGDSAAGTAESRGFLQAYEIYGMKLARTRLVVLSACRTGIEQQYDGEGAVSAARPFLVAGVPVVVASLWPVDTEASAELMANFHEHRRREFLPAARALGRAQAEMAHGADARYRSPFYWAAFVAVGGT